MPVANIIANKANKAVKLINSAIAFNTYMAFRHFGAAYKAGFALVAGFCIYFGRQVGDFYRKLVNQ